MARVELGSQAWGWLTDSNGNPQGNTSATLKNLDGTNATTWSAITAGTSSTAALTSNSDGTLPRYVEEGPYTLTVGATTRRVEAVSAAFTAALDGSGATDSSARLQDVLTRGAGATVTIPPTPSGGFYKLLSQVVVPVGTTVRAYGATFKHQFEDHAVIFYTPTARTPTTTYQLTVDSVVGAFTVTVSTSDAANFTAGDRVTLRDATYSLGGENCRRETNIVKSVNTGTGVITLDRPVGHVYTAANDAWIAKVTTASGITWLGGEFDLTAVTGAGGPDCDAIYADWPERCLVQDVTVHNHPEKCVDFHGGIDSTIRDCNAYSPSADGAGQGYNMRVHYSRDCRIEGGWSRNIRHHADISGGQGCRIVGGQSAGRTTTNQCGAFLHGLESRWCSIRGFKGQNIEVAAGAGNGTFGADFDFLIESESTGCDYGWFIAQGCVNGKVRGRADQSVIRGLAIDNSSCDVDVVVDGIQTNPSNYGAVNIAGTADVTGRVVIRNALYRSLQVTSSGTVALDVDIDHPSTASSIPVVGSSLASTSRMSIGGRVKANNAALAAIATTGSASAWLTLRRDLEITGTYSARVSSASQLFGVTQRETEGTAAPAAGTWERGDRCWNTTPSAAGTPGWVCTTAGSPGTWKAMANVAA